VPACCMYVCGEAARYAWQPMRCERCACMLCWRLG